MDSAAVTGTAGSPTTLAAGGFDYRWSETNSTLYSVNFEAALVKVTLESDLAGWGEAQAPLAPDVACLIVEQLLRPAVEGQDFDGSPDTVRSLRESDVLGHARSWADGRLHARCDCRGRHRSVGLGRQVSRDFGRGLAVIFCPQEQDFRAISRGSPEQPTRSGWRERGRPGDEGFRIFKLFYDRTEDELFDLIDRLREALGPEASIAVDALWRLDETSALNFGGKLDERGALWLECPLAPESPAGHADLAAGIRTPIALGESYRTRYELAPFLASGCVRWLQPDIGRWGITEAAELARDTGAGARIVPHISIAMGPQIAAALQFAASSSNVGLAEYNPVVFTVANHYLDRPLEVDGAEYLVPEGPGLGVELDESAVRAVAGRVNVTPAIASRDS